MVTAKTTSLWTRLRQAQLLTQGMEAPCSTHTHDTAALKALGEMDILAGLLGELLAQALEQVEALERVQVLEPLA